MTVEPMTDDRFSAAESAADTMLKAFDAGGVPLSVAFHTMVGVMVGMCVTAAPSPAEAIKLFETWADTCRRRIQRSSAERPDLVGAGWSRKQ